MSFRIGTRIIGTTAIFLAVVAGLSRAREGVIDLKFQEPPASGSDVSRTLQSIVKVQGTGGLQQDALYLITHYGDRGKIFEEENRRTIRNPWRNDTWRHCSVFSAPGASSVLMGRNWDNQNVGSVILNLYHPASGYSSVFFSRAMDLGFPLNVDLEQIASTDFGRKLLLAPFYAVDGINERGLAVSLAGVREVTHQPKEGEDPVFVTYLVRKILDQAKSVEEAMRLAGRFVPFDLDRNSLNTHLFIADASGRSVILEYAEGRWNRTYPTESWQVLTNRPVSGVADSVLREKCSRYRGISEALESAGGRVDWKTGMKILQGAKQKGTTWSVVYSLPERELYFSVYQDWDTTYRLKAPFAPKAAASGSGAPSAGRPD